MKRIICFFIGHEWEVFSENRTRRITLANEIAEGRIEVLKD